MDDDKRFTFHLLESPVSALGSGDLPEQLRKWGLGDTSRSARVSFDQAVRPHEVQGLVRQLMGSTVLCDAMETGGVFCRPRAAGDAWIDAPDATIDTEPLLSDVTRLSFFETAAELGLVRGARGDTGRTTVKCADTDVRGVLVSDRLRHAMVLAASAPAAGDENDDDEGDDPDNTMEDDNLYDDMPTPPAARTGGGWPRKDRKQLIFQIFQHLILGGAMCQYDDTLDPYLDATKKIYKELAAVQRKKATDGEGHEIEVVSHAVRVRGVSWGELFVRPGHPGNFCLVSVDPVHRHATVWYFAYVPLW